MKKECVYVDNVFETHLCRSDRSMLVCIPGAISINRTQPVVTVSRDIVMNEVIVLSSCTCVVMPVGRKYEGGGGSTREACRALTAGGLGQLKAPRSSWVFGAKSCILAFWRQIISVLKSSIFSSVISHKMFIKGNFLNKIFDLQWQYARGIKH